MYVTLYNGNVHPGVNMVFWMGGLIGSNDEAAITTAGDKITAWATAASHRIVDLITEARTVIGFFWFQSSITLGHRNSGCKRMSATSKSVWWSSREL